MSHLTDSQKWLVLVCVLLFVALMIVLSPILSPFLTAALLAYLGDPLVDFFERHRLSRTQGVVATFCLLILVFVVSAFLVVPALVNQIDQLVSQIPSWLVWANEVATPYLESRLGIELAQVDWMSLSQQLDWGATGNVVRGLLSNITASSMAVVALVGNLVLIPVVTFYLLRDWDLMVERIGLLIPRYQIATVSKLAKESHETLIAFFRGQVLVMLSLSIIYAVGLMLMGLDIGLLVGLIAGLASIVPYLGAVIGIGAGLTAAFFQFGDVFHLVLVLVVFGVGQTLESTVLTPKLVGDRIGLHPVAVIFAVLAGGQLFGFVGILLALPAAAVMMVMMRYAHLNYKNSTLYTHLSNNESAMPAQSEIEFSEAPTKKDETETTKP